MSCLIVPLAGVRPVPARAAGGTPPPFPGSIDGVTFTDSQHGWAVGVSAGGPLMLATADGGVTWSRVTLPSATPWLNAISFGDDQHGWAVGEGDTYISTSDGGLTWTAHSIAPAGGSLGPDWRFYGVKAVGQDTVWLAGSSTTPDDPIGVGNGFGTIVGTVDGGNTWTIYGAPGPLFGITFTDRNHGWAVGRTSGGPTGWRAVIMAWNGTGWTGQTIPSEAVGGLLRGVTFTDRQHGWAVGKTSDQIDPAKVVSLLMSTVDGGLTWNPLPVADVPQTQLYAVAFADNLHGWAVGSRGDASTDSWSPVILETRTGGLEWSMATVPEESSFRYVSTVPGYADASLHAVTVRPPATRGSTTQPWAGGVGGCGHGSLMTDSSDSPWRDLFAQPYMQDSTTAYASSSGVLWVGGSTCGGLPAISRSNDGGGTWHPSSTPPILGLDVNGITFSDDHHGWAIGHHLDSLMNVESVLLDSTDGGRSWQLDALPAGMAIGLYSAVSFPDNNHGWIFGASGFVLRTTNGGRTWTSEKVPRGIRSLSAGTFKLAWDGSYHGWAAGQAVEGGPVLITTSDGGATWSMAQGWPDGVAGFQSLAFTDVSRGWVGAWVPNGGASVLRTSDGGRSWAPVPIPNVTMVGALTFVDPSHGWAITNSNDFVHPVVVYATADGGLSWSAQSSPDEPVALAFANLQIGIAVGFRFAFLEGEVYGPYARVLTTGSGGTTWTAKTLFVSP